MSIIETLTEGIVNRDMKKEGTALLNKWTKTGLLEGLSDSREKHTMARLLENQAKELLRESASTMAGGDVAGFAAVAFPIVRRVFAGLIANDLVSVQPMSLPSGLIFFLDFTFGTPAGGKQGTVAGESIYGGGRVGSGIIDGILLNNNTMDKQPQGMLSAYSSATSSAELTLANITQYLDGTAVDAAAINGSQTLTTVRANATYGEKVEALLQYDPDVFAELGAKYIRFVDFAQAGMTEFSKDMFQDIDLNQNDQDSKLLLVASGSVIRRLQREPLNAGSSDVMFVVYADVDVSSHTGLGVTASYPVVDKLSNVGATSIGAVVGASPWPLENQTEIPEINIKVDSTAITAGTKKLKAKWTPELGQDLNAYHNLDAEVELTSILSEQIALEIDREILGDLIHGAKAAVFYWSRSPGLFVKRDTGIELGASSAAPDFTGTVSEWYETLIETINDVSAQIHRKTLRGGANFVVCGPEVANILEFTSGYRANVTADSDKGDIGAVKTGSLNRKFDVIVDPYFIRNVILVGRKGNSFLESGYVYAPYVPLQTTPTIFGPEDFVPRKGVMTRYGKKMVRPDMYGLVIVEGLLGQAGATS